MLPGDIVAYRCEDCLDRWDLVLPEDEEFPLEYAHRQDFVR